jgi:dTDP-glucose 4,6-dehydratase
MSRWLITGGAGFIGANFVRMAAGESRASLVVLDALTYAGNLANIADLVHAGRVNFVKGDICDEQLVSGLFMQHDFDRVVHFAAESHVDRSILGPRPFIRTNVEGTCILLEAARAAWSGNADVKRFLHVSTDEVYGSLNPGDPAFTEHSPYRPSSPYSASKAAADHLARAWCHTFGLPVIVSNCSNNYGPLQFPEKLIPLMILNAIDERPLPVYGDGLQVRDWLHVEDHCRALLAILEHGRPGETYVIGGDCERANIDIVHRICEEVDALLQRAKGTTSSLIRHVTDRPGHDRRYAMNAARIQRELGWKPTHSIEEALPKVVRWYHEHREWAESIRSGAYLEYYDRQYGARV